MASDWKTFRLGDLVELTSGFAFKSSDFRNDGIAVIKIKNVKAGKIDLSDLSFVDPSFAVRRADKLVQPEDVLITMSGNRFGSTKETWVGKVARFGHHGAFLLNQRVGVLRAKEGVPLSPRFCAYALSSDQYQEFFVQIGTSSGGQANLSPAQILGVEFALPPLDVQEQVATLAGSLDDRIEQLVNSNRTLESIAQAIFKSWFVDFDPVRAKAEGREPEGMDAATAALFPDEFEERKERQIPKGWKNEPLGAITIRITKGTTPTTLKRRFVDSGINFIKAESISDAGYLLPEKFAFIDESTDHLLKRSKIEKSDVLVTIAGTIGRIAVVPLELLPANTNQAVGIIRPNADLAPASFVRRFLCLPDTQQALNEKTVQAVQANVSLATLSSLEVVLPPPHVMRKLCALTLEPIDEKIGCNIRLSTTLRDLRDTLLPRLISGKLRVPEAEKLVEAVV